MTTRKQTKKTAAPTTKPTNAPVHAAPVPDGELKAAWEATRAEREALAPTALTLIAFDVPTAATTILGALPAIEPLRDQIVALGGISAARFARIKQHAQAALYAHARWFGTSRPAASLPELHARALSKRELLLRAADSAADKQLMPRDRLAEIRKGQGYLDTINDLTALSAMFRAAWPRLVTRTVVEPADLVEVDELTAELIAAVNLRDGTDTEANAAADDRRRAVTLMSDDWHEVRRALLFLRYHEDDADAFAPSLYIRTRAATTPAKRGEAQPPEGEKPEGEKPEGKKPEGDAVRPAPANPAKPEDDDDS